MVDNIIVTPLFYQDMLQKVRDQRPSYNNASAIASSVTISSIKLIYYQMFALAYSWAGQHAQVVMVNSSWTMQHVKQLWWGETNSSSRSEVTKSRKRKSGSMRGRNLALVYPPCNTTELLAMDNSIDRDDRERNKSKVTPGGKREGKEKGKCSISGKRIILSIGQFRPEKDHMLQIRAMKCLLDTYPW